MRLGPTGYLGIGTTNPGSRLEVQGLASAQYFNATSTTATSTFSGGIVGPNNFIVQQSSGNVGIGTASSDSLQINTTVSDTVRGADNVRIGVVGGFPSVYLEDASSQQWKIANTAGTLSFARPGVATDVVFESGNVGIGTTTPKALVHADVSGTGSAFELSRDGELNGWLRVSFPSQYTTLNSYEGFVFQQDGTEFARITNTGNVGIGTTSPGTFKLQVKGDVGPDAASNYNLGSAALNWGCLYYNGGTQGICASDERLKQNIQDMQWSGDPLTEVAGLRPRTFEFKSATGTTYNGLIAQEA